MIIFGTRGITRTMRSGAFHCPACGPDQGYRLQRVRRWFTLYFVPLIPLDVLGEYIECDTCRGTFRPAVLTWDPVADQAVFEAELNRAVRRTMVLMMLADSMIEEREVATIREVYEKVAGRTLTEQAVRDEAREAAADGRDVRAWLHSVAPTLNDSGKEMVLKAAWFVAVADTEFAASEQRLLDEIGAALDMDRAWIDGLLGSTDG